MRNVLAGLSLTLITVGCAPPGGGGLPAGPGSGCGLLGCISSPYLRARGAGMVGADVGRLISVMGGAPTSTYDLDADRKILTWTRTQSGRDIGVLSCTETFRVTKGMVESYERQGACGG